MIYSSKKDNSWDSLEDSLAKVIKGLDFELLDFSVSRRKGSVQVKIVLGKGTASVSINDCSLVHRAVLPKLELAFGIPPDGPDIYTEVSSPGINRTIKEGREFIHYYGRPFLCYRKDNSGWSGGILLSSDEKGIVLKTKDGDLKLDYENIGKAKLDNEKANSVV